MNEYLFSYGTLQKEQVQLALFGRALTGDRDILKGFRRDAIEITDELFLSKGEEKEQTIAVHSDDLNDLIEGMAFELSMEEISIADKYEPLDYKRVKVKLESGKEAWVYAAKF